MKHQKKEGGIKALAQRFREMEGELKLGERG